MRRLCFYILLLLLVYACRSEIQDEPIGPEETDNNTTTEESATEYLEGWIRIKFEREPGDTIQPVMTRNGAVSTGISELDSIMLTLGATRVERVFADGGKFRERRRRAGLHLWYDFYIGKEVPVSRAMNNLGVWAGIHTIERIPVYRQSVNAQEKRLNQRPPNRHPANSRADEPDEITYPFDDAELSRQHHLFNPGNIPSAKAGADIHVFPAWKKATGSPDVIVAILDGGIDYNHPDLVDNMWVNEEEQLGAEGIDNDNNGYVNDIYGWRFPYENGEVNLPGSPEIQPLDHATHCAGIIGAVSNNGIGIAGIAGGSGNGDGVRLMCCQIFVSTAPAETPNFTEVVGTGKADDAWAYAADNGAVIASCSFGNPELSLSYREAISYFITYAGIDTTDTQTGPMRGGVIICSAGNDNQQTLLYPAAHENCIAVAAIAPNYKKPSYSNYGSWISLCAPGGAENGEFDFGIDGAIFSTLPTQSPNGIMEGYGYKAGTSMACPQVAGVAALIVSHFGGTGSGFTADELVSILCGATRNIDSYNPGYAGKLGSGLIDATLALKKDEGTPPAAVSRVKVTWIYNATELTWLSTPDQNYLPTTQYELFWSTSPLTGFDPENPGEEVVKLVVPNTQPIGKPLEYVVEGFRESTHYYLAIVAVDEYGNRSNTCFFDGATDANLPPMLHAGNEITLYLESCEAIRIRPEEYFYDPEGETLNYTVFSTHFELLEATVDEEGVLLQPKADGLCRVNIIAKDPQRASCHLGVTVMIRQSREEVDLYPVPVTHKLNIRMGKEVDTTAEVTIYNITGQKILNTLVDIKPFAPGSLNLSSLSAGSYFIDIRYNNKSLRRNFVKL